jgi:hypothetical protein
MPSVAAPRIVVFRDRGVIGLTEQIRDIQIAETAQFGR